MNKISNISIPANRFKAMLQMIPRAPDSISTEQLLEKLNENGLEVEKHTVQRNLKILHESKEFGLELAKELGLPTKESDKDWNRRGRKSNYWCYRENAPITLFPSLDDHTALAFRLADAFLQSLMPPETVHALRPFVDEAGRHLAKRRQAAAGKWQDKIHVFPRGLRRKSPPIAKEIRDAVYQALLDEKAIHIVYATPGKPVAKELTISPLGLIVRDYSLYLIGLPKEQYERPEKKILSFALHRIRAIGTPDDVKFLRPAGFALADHEDPLGKPRTGESKYYDLVIRIGPHTLISMQECPLAGRQTLEKDATDEEGRTVLKARVPNTEELRQWIRSLGPNAEVIEPKTARILEEAKGKVSTGNSLILSGGGGYKMENYQPWKTSITGQITGNRFMGSGVILGMDGSRLRDCSVDLTLVSPQTVSSTAKPLDVIKATEVQPKSDASWPYSKTYEEISTLADGRVGKIAYKTLSRTTTINDLKQGRLFMTDTAHAVLTLPDTGKAPYPIMVIAHSSAGVQNKDYDWARWFNQLGIATLVVDTFSPRGIVHSANDQSVLYYGATVGEYLVALKLLATHQALDVSRAGIIGFSRGGVAAMATAIDSIRRGVVGNKLKYAVHFPLYGGCHYRAERWTGSPIHLFVGAEDSYEDMDVCRGWLTHVKSAGIDAQLTIFPSVHHGFDNPAQPNLRTFPEAEYWKDCKVEWNIDSNQFKSAQSPYWHSDNTLMQESAPCRKRGVSVKYDEFATSNVKEAVLKQLRALGFI